MNIAYRGNFLRDGLSRLGHRVLDIPAAEDDIGAAVGRLGSPVDFVLLELWGHYPVPDVANCRHELVAYCIDSPINEFWQAPACGLFDHVFVDQRRTVDSFAIHGIRAAWLPLCAHESWFADKREKRHDISFVGTVNANRLKRKNLLALLDRNFGVNVVHGVDMARTRDIFAGSRITLNENLFSGLTLRVFQGLAAGSVVLTEAGSDGADAFFRDGEHLAFYNGTNILDVTAELLASPDRLEHMSDAGRRLCRERHTSECRAGELLSALAAGSARNERPDAQEAQWRQARAEYLFAMRFGGRFDSAVRNFHAIARRGQERAADALTELGSIYARQGRCADAESFFLKAASAAPGPRPWLKLALLRAGRDDTAGARQALDAARKFYPAIAEPGMMKNDAALIMFMVARLYFISGDIFHMGFSKSFADDVPDTAFEAAFNAWRREPGPQVMELLLQCLAPVGLEGELLPELVWAIRHGILTDSQILRTAEIAASYYDPDTAGTIIAAFRKAK